MNPAGKQVRRLTHTNVDPLLQGLYPTAWSANGKRLLAEFDGQDTTYAVTVNPQTGAQRPLIEATEQGFARHRRSPPTASSSSARPWASNLAPVTTSASSPMAAARA